MDDYYGEVKPGVFGEVQELIDCSMCPIFEPHHTGHYYYVDPPKLRDKRNGAVYYGVYEEPKHNSVWCRTQYNGRTGPRIKDLELINK